MPPRCRAPPGADFAERRGAERHHAFAMPQFSLSSFLRPAIASFSLPPVLLFSRRHFTAIAAAAHVARLSALLSLPPPVFAFSRRAAADCRCRQRLSFFVISACRH